jgi:hypothetical protein
VRVVLKGMRSSRVKGHACESCNKLKLFLVPKDDSLMIQQRISPAFTLSFSPNEDFGRPDGPFVDLSECVFEALFNVS